MANKTVESIRRLVRLTAARESLDRALFTAKLGMIRADQAMDVVNQAVFEGKVTDAVNKLHEFDLTYGVELKQLKDKLGNIKSDPDELEFYD
jgi:hypothetical protein